LIDADHDKGAWRSHIKVFTHDGKYRRLFHEQRKYANKEAVAESGYYILQTASINCKNDHPSILTNTCTYTLDAGYD
jgi:hypothetical protein